jgi:hypothetical protein
LLGAWIFVRLAWVVTPMFYIIVLALPRIHTTIIIHISTSFDLVIESEI